MDQTPDDNYTTLKLEKDQLTRRIASLESALEKCQSTFQHVINNSQDASYQRNLATNVYDYLSPTIENFSGRTVEEMAALSLLDVLALIHPDDRAHTEAAVKKSMSEGGNIRIVEYRFLHKDGKYRWWQDQFKTIKDANGRPLYYTGTVRDITKQKEVEKQEKALLNIADAINYIQDLPTLYRFIHETIREVLSFNNLYIGHYNEMNDTTIIVFDEDEKAGSPLLGTTIIHTFKSSTRLSAYLLRTAGILCLSKKDILTLSAEEGIEPLGTIPEEWLGLTLKTQEGKITGFMATYTYDPEFHFSEKDKTFLSLVSIQLASLVARLQIEAVEREQRQLNEALLDIAAALNSTLELDEVINRIFTNLKKVISHESADLILIQGEQTCVFSGGDPSGITPVERQSILSNAWIKFPNLNRIYTTGQPLVYPDVLESPEWIVLPESEWIHSHMGVPLKIKGKVVGFLLLNSSEPDFFHHSMVGSVQAFADQAAIAIENARLYAKVQQLAIADELTGLYNRRGFFEMGEREVERSIRFGHPLAALFIDIDHFKQFNDAYSYSVGDQVLRLLSDTLRSGLREVDLIGRYGGEEFVVLLPETGQSAASQIAERLRKLVEAARLSTEWGELGITVSIGGCMRTSSLPTLSALIERAGQGVHQAKNTGRNRVVFI